MKKAVILILFLLLIPIVFSQLTIQKIEPKIYSPYDYVIPKINYIKVCEEKETKCENNSFLACRSNSWTTLQKCSSEEYCDVYKGCVKKQTYKIPTKQVLPIYEIAPTITPQLPSLYCRENDVKCSSQRTNSVMICKSNQWMTQQKCSPNEECVVGKGCVSKTVQDTCEKTRSGVRGVFRGRTYNYDATCQGNLLFTYSCGNEGHYSMKQTNCGDAGCTNGSCNIDACEATENGVRGIFRGRTYNYNSVCQDNSYFTYNCNNEGRYAMQEERCEFGCNKNGCNLNTCDETLNGVRGVFRGRAYDYDATCQENLLFTYQCSPEGTYVMMQTNCEQQGCSNGACNVDTCEQTINGVKGKFRGQEYNYNDQCQDNSYFTYNCNNEERYAMQEKRCETNEYCVESEGCKKSFVILPIEKPTLVNKIRSYFVNIFTPQTDKKTSNQELINKIKEQRKEIKQEITKIREKLSETEALNKAELESYLQSLEDNLNTIGEDAQLANVDLQNTLQQQQQTMQMLSSISKNMHDVQMAIIRNIGGSAETEEGTERSEVKKTDNAQSALDIIEKSMDESSNDKKEIAETLKKLEKSMKSLEEIKENLEGKKTGVPIDVNELVQWVIRENYLETTEDLYYYAEKIKFFNDMKKQIRKEIERTKKELNEENVKEELLDLARKHFEEQTTQQQTQESYVTTCVCTGNDCAPLEG